MQGLIPESTLSEIQLKIDIVELISQYVPLKNAGRNYRALCPFHSEKTPSFMVNPEKQIFHCFGCGAGGNIFGFVMRHENISFPEAVEWLAEKAGVQISTKDFDPQASHKKRLYEIMEKVADYFESELLKNPKAVEAKNYLKSRGFDGKTVKTFRVGYCSDDESAFLKEMNRLNIEEPLLEKAGILSKKDRSWHLRFRGRIMFPILDVQGRVVGFGGRAMGDHQPKYLNSPETVLFNKSHILYGLNLAKKAILQKSQVILVEGYVDVISVFRAGVENVVASLGTAFNEGHVSLIRRYAQEVVVAYDGDEAGLEASLRALEIFLGQNIIVRVATMPPGHDPDSWVRKAGREAFEKIIQDAPSMIDFKLNILLKRFSGKTEKDKLQITKLMLPTIGQLKNAVLQDHYLKSLSQKLEISEKALRQELPGPKRGKEDQNKPERSETVAYSLEEDVLKILMAEKTLVADIQKEVDPDDFEIPEYRLIFEKIIKGDQDLYFEKNEEMQSLLSRLMMDGGTSKDSKSMLKKCVKALKERSYERRKKDLKQQIKDLERKDRKSEKIIDLLNQIQNLEKKKRELQS